MRRDRRELHYRPDRSGSAKVLGELESLVMETVWKRGDGSVREIHADLEAQGEDLAYTTVMTVMSRLFDKRYLRRRTEGKSFRYRPAISRERFLAEASGRVFSGMAEDLSGPVLSAFVENLSREDARRLEEIARQVEKRRRERGRKGKRR